MISAMPDTIAILQVVELSAASALEAQPARASLMSVEGVVAFRKCVVGCSASGALQLGNASGSFLSRGLSMHRCPCFRFVVGLTVCLCKVRPEEVALCASNFATMGHPMQQFPSNGPIMGRTPPCADCCAAFFGKHAQQHRSVGWCGIGGS